jgi:Kef-type K+ transport system membrane component KefB
MVSEIFAELSLVIIISIVVILLIRVLRQPLIIGYIITGILVGPSVFNIIKSAEIITILSELGIALLLFVVGINLNPKIIKEVGKVSLITGLGQVIFTSLIGYVLALALGFNHITSIYLAIALTFSSTIIITKLLSDKGDLNKLYGKISIGFLIVQDLIVVIALMLISSISNGGTIASFAINTFLIGAGLLVSLFAVGHFIIPKITKYVARSSEFLLLFSLGWCLAIASLFEISGFSIEIGALLAGITLSLSPYRFEISSKLKPLRDFFIFLFFIWLGSQLVFDNITNQIPAILIFSFFILIGNPFIVMVLMGYLKYKKRTGFLAGLTVAQISEFSLILIALGVKLNHIPKEILSLVTLVGLITIAGSTYFIIYSDKIYPLISPYLSIFERKTSKATNDKKPKQYDVILFGAHRAGHDILEAFKTNKKSMLIVDHNPDIVEKVSKQGFDCIYGDISDTDLLDEIDICNSKMVISTIPDTETNLIFIKRAKLCNKRAIVLAVANSAEDAFLLYETGATYVITPTFIGGKHISKKVKSYQYDTKKFLAEQKEHKKHLHKLKDI